MQSAINVLLSISSEPIVAVPPNTLQMQAFLQSWKGLGRELGEVLVARNGFWAYESSLLVRPLANGVSPLGLLEWNEVGLWKHEYDLHLNQVLFFAEDAFGCQHCFSGDKVCVFDPETGQFEELAHSLEEWAQIITSDYEYRTGYPLAHAWQMENEILQPGMRLLPKRPFVVGGEFELRNLYAGDEVDGMVFRASIATRIRDVPDGGEIVFKIVNNGK